MRVPKGSVVHGQDADEGDWETLVAQAKARADDEWQSAVQAAKARVDLVQADDEQEWQQALARSKRIAQLQQSSELRLARPQPVRPARPGRALARPGRAVSGAAPANLVASRATAPAAAAVAAEVAADELEWRLLRRRADERSRQSQLPVHMLMQTARSDIMAPPPPRPVQAPRIIAWP
jgi:hypothetical protein